MTADLDISWTPKLRAAVAYAFGFIITVALGIYQALTRLIS